MSLEPKGDVPKGGPRLFYLLPFIAIGLVLGAVIVAWQPPETVSNAPTAAPQAPSLKLEGFAAGNLISDDDFFDVVTMTEEDIVDFLNQWNSGCQPGPSQTPCITDYREDTPTWPPDQYCPSGFIGAEDDTAASIIMKSALACQINPQVLLTILQKEQGLITASGERLTQRRYDTAMGYGCPDGADCDPAYFGFARQVYGAARQFQIYRALPEKYDVVADRVNTIAYHVNPECGSSEVFVENQATAGLYNYTPYQPNEVALEGRYDDCSTWGNMNFYGLYNAWFREAG
ncbi:MAG: hemagglutinin [Actinomycetaceae bacterium]|nr:hemagglutinin [Actinomycetaceae bacterium]